MNAFCLKKNLNASRPSEHPTQGGKCQIPATKETTVTQQVSHRPIKCQSRLWSQRGAKVNALHRGDNPILRPTGIQIATKSYATLQAMAPTNIKTVHQTSLQRSQQQRRQITLQPVLINKVQVSQGHISYKNKENCNTEIHGGGGLELVKPARKQASSRPKPCASLKKPHECCPFAAPCGPRRKKNDGGQTSAFPSKTSRFHAFDSRAQGFSPPLARQRSSCPPPSPNLVLTHPIEHY